MSTVYLPISLSRSLIRSNRTLSLSLSTFVSIKVQVGLKIIRIITPLCYERRHKLCHKKIIEPNKAFQQIESQ